MQNLNQNHPESLVSVRSLHKIFDISGGFLDQLTWRNGRLQREKNLVKAITNVSFEIKPGETLSVVGESGCGKSTLGRTIIGLHPPNSGEVHYNQIRIDTLSPKQMLPFRRRMQMIFQDPYASLNPRKRVNQILQEPLAFHFPRLTNSERKDWLEEVLLQVGGDPQWLGRLPHEFSGGQRQRISIARALVVDPEFIVACSYCTSLRVTLARLL